MKILFCIPRIPYPVDSGAKIRTYNLIKEIKKNNNEVTVLSFLFDKKELAAVEEFRRLGVDLLTVAGKDKITLGTIFKAIFGFLPVSVAKYSSNEFSKCLKHLLQTKKFNLVHFDHIHMAQYIKCCGKVPAVIDEHNVEAVILQRLAQSQKNIFLKWLFTFEYKKMYALEKKLCNKSALVTICSEDDQKIIIDISQNRNNVKVITNGVETDYFSPITKSDGSVVRDSDLVFTGSMDWLPNEDAIIYFSKEILPIIWQEKPDTKLYVVGKNPSEKIIELGANEPRIVITGKVVDVRPYIKNSGVYVVPIRFGGGTRLKILEAMSMCKAIVSTKIGAEGIKYTDNKDIVISENVGIAMMSPLEENSIYTSKVFQDKEAMKFAYAVINLLNNSSKRETLGKNAREMVVKKYDWHLIGSKLNTAYFVVSK